MQSKITFWRVSAAILVCVITGFAWLVYSIKDQKLYTEVAPPKPSLDFVSTILPYPIDYVYDRIQAQFDSESRNYFEDYNRAIYDLPEKVLTYKELSREAYEKFMGLPLVKPSKFYVFYGAYAVKQKLLSTITPVNVIGFSNPALVRYASLPPEKRTYDMYVWSPDTPYWYSEYMMNGVKLPFRSYFIIHLEAAGDNHTAVEIIEEKPVVRLEGKPSIDENGILQDFTLHDVIPTTSDRTFLLSCIQQFIERGVPSRSKFNCRDGTEPPPVKWSNP